MNQLTMLAIGKIALIMPPTLATTSCNYVKFLEYSTTFPE